jgi:methionine transaminase
MQLPISKLPQAGTTIFSEMSALALQYKAINLGQGFADYPMNKDLCQLVADAMAADHNQYAPMPGLPSLRQAISEKINFLYQYQADWETEITITPGGTYGIYTALTSILHQGDEAIILEPAYDSYASNIILNHATPIFVPLSMPDFSVDWNKVAAAITAKTKVVIINTPHNPGGYTFTADDWHNLWKIIEHKNIFIVSDEVYEHIVMDGKQHESILRYPELAARAFAVFSFGKVYHNTGWKMGYVVAPKNMTAEFRKIHQYLVFTCNTPMQVALAEFLERKDEYQNLPNFFQNKRDLFLDAMQDTGFIVHKKASGSFFQTMSYENISDLDDTTFAKELVIAKGVATIPLSPFYQAPSKDKFVRFCFAKKDETLVEAGRRLKIF